ncbi:metalloregulator ArsR/SmtB family transcription factor [Devosia sp. YIM 151766]|uniref:ArsR/SmtB family transcription factor n=1 Tax=Devosia sp. YIM 151766 TaxID=3017325 RepID=UPI00255D029A|nr:metalloregulator ArsR/SmtB family transcription factor [Devosia sp. YIM 151766]WIY54079.1 metalloregulator ArsR/SmtB family transcription factor [Devosia sp. YIM 151766]
MNRKPKPPVALYSALADATRCRIMEILVGGPMPVHRLAEAFSISRPAISRHLRVLKQAGLVAEVKQGRENLYAFRPRKLVNAVRWIENVSVSEPKPDIAAAPIVLALPAIEPAATGKSPRPHRPIKAESVTQMGFDF